jgi:transglutaminase-like putative cysteine protease
MALMVLLGFVPGLVVLRGRGRVAVAVSAAAAGLLALSYAFHVSLGDARLGDAERDFFGPVFSSLGNGMLDFYEADLPFSRVDFPLMHSVVLIAVFVFVAAVCTMVAAQKPIGASLALVAAVGWPATLIPENPIRAGVLGLIGVLAILFLLREGARPTRGLAQGLAVGLVLVLAAVTASSSDAVSKGAFLSWQGWDPYDRPDTPVGVDYVWDSNYTGLKFPKKQTVVFRVKVAGDRRGLYWRATTLDEYTGTAWRERVSLGQPSEIAQVEASRAKRFLPKEASREKGWVRQEITVAAFRDEHLVASAQPMRWQPPEGTDVAVGKSGDVVVVPPSLRRDQKYTVWSYVPRLRPRRLAEAGTTYPAAVTPYLEVAFPVALPAFGSPGRDAVMQGFFTQFADSAVIAAHESLYRRALEVVGEADSPYEAAAALEAWFREDGGFTYDEQPPPFGVEPPLVDFVLNSQQGYCQHFAGAMAVMLRLLGVPARVAAGFTHGTYDSKKREWTVTDHNAHTWVEVYFPGHGWLPFDPTPGRGQLGAPYSAVSPDFDLRDTAMFEGILPPNRLQELESRRTQREPEQSPAGPEGGTTSVVRDHGPSIVGLALAVIAAGLALLFLVKTVRRALRFATRDPRALAGACRRDLVGFLADQGVELDASATIGEVGRAVQEMFAIDAGRFVGFATAARFGPPGDSGRAVSRARHELRRVRAALRRELGLVGRLRGAVSLRSLAL